MSYAKVKVAGITVDIRDAKNAEEAKARWERAKAAIDSLFVALSKESS